MTRRIRATETDLAAVATRGRRSTVRTIGAVAVAVVLLFVASSCGSSGGDTAAGSPGSDTTGPDAGGAPDAFPVTIAHRYGDTTIEEQPERVVTVGLTDQDAALAVGVVPVGTTEWFGNHPGAIWPWATDALGQAAVPEVVGSASLIGFEKIAALRPDVILAVYSGLTQADYDKLSQIAPTVAQPKEYVDYGVPWDEQTLTIGRALGQSAKAEAAVASVQAQFDAAKAANPDFAGATGVAAVPTGGTIAVYAPEDARGRFLASLGFTQPAEIAELAGSEFSADLSYEQISLLDGDVVVWIVGSIATDKAKFDEEPLYASLAVHTGGHEVFVENLSTVGGALSFQSVLSLPLLLDELVPQIAAAVKGTGGS